MRLILGERDRVRTGVIRVHAVTDLEIDGSSRCVQRKGVRMPRVVAGDLPKIRRILIVDPEHPAVRMTGRGSRGACGVCVSVKRI